MAFIMCVERGNLENQAILLCRSIRTFAGRFADAAIYTFQPREGTEIAPDTLAMLSDLNATHITERLNTDFHDYPIGNKVFVSAWAEEHLQEDIVVFLDSDTFFVQPPDLLDLPADIDAAVRPVDRKRWGSAGTDDKKDTYWQRLYDLCGVNERPHVQTNIDREEIRAYFNAGLIAVRRSSGRFVQWREDFLMLMAADHLPANRKIQFMDQMALAATMSRDFKRVSTLNDRYNYPLPLRVIMKSEYAAAQLDDLVHVHYHKWFNKPGFLQKVRPELDCDSPMVKWLEPSLPFEPINDMPMKFRGVDEPSTEEAATS